MNSILNISAYKFVVLPDAAALRERLYAQAAALGLRGTVLLAAEGINLFLAGPAQQVRGLLAYLQQDPRLADLQPKQSWSDSIPFRKLRVKVKHEIIRMNQPAIRPAAARARAVTASTLKRWLDQGHDHTGRPLLMLDTRNAFEVQHGSFVGAVDWGISKFSDFPQALQARRAELQGKTVVSFCTGGIRCEKAALYMQQNGLESVLQLDGGILKYFEEVGSAHYQGKCFVFDERQSLGPELQAHPL